MPKKQSTASKEARQKARGGEKFTTALRAAGPAGGAGPHLPPYVELLDDGRLSEGERMVVDGLRALAAGGGPLPVREVEPAPEVIADRARAEAKGGRPQRKRWASVEAAVDGYVLRETLYGPNRSGYTATSRGPRVPVPLRATDGTLTVVAMPEWARWHEGRWIWVHTGWPLDAPGRLVDPPQVFSPAPELCWEVAVWLDLSLQDGRVLGEDYVGGSSGWETVGWCTTREDARLIARARTAHRGPYSRADVLQHGSDRGVASLTRDTYLQAPDAPERPQPVTAPGPRPASPGRSEIPEPAWHGLLKDEPHPPNSSLIVWTGTAWRTLVWTDWQSRNIAAALGVGAGGPYTWAEDWGPRYPDRDLHDWIQEGRELAAQFPEPSHPERNEGFAAERRAREDALVNALAERGDITREEAAARLAQGGEQYRTVLDIGQATISRALHTARCALPEGPERTAARHALDDLTGRHLLPADAERIAGAQLDREIEADRDPNATAWCRRAVAEYITPAPDPAAAGIDGFHPST